METGRNVFDREKGYMSDDVFNAILPNLNKYSRDLTLGFFGESTLHPKFNEYVDKLAYKKKYKLILNSNCSLLTKNDDQTLRKFNMFRISMDSPVESEWQDQCPGGNVIDINGNTSSDRLRVLQEKTLYWLSLKSRPTISLIYVTSSRNIKTIDQFAKKWCKYLRGGDMIIVKRMLT